MHPANLSTDASQDGPSPPIAESSQHVSPKPADDAPAPQSNARSAPRATPLNSASNPTHEQQQTLLMTNMLQLVADTNANITQCTAKQERLVSVLAERVGRLEKKVDAGFAGMRETNAAIMGKYMQIQAMLSKINQKLDSRPDMRTRAMVAKAARLGESTT